MADRQPPASQSEKKEKSIAEFETSANELLERSRQLLEAAAAYSSKLKAEGDAIGSQATALGKDIKALQTEVSKAADRDEISIDEAEKVWNLNGLHLTWRVALGHICPLHCSC